MLCVAVLCMLWCLWLCFCIDKCAAGKIPRTSWDKALSVFDAPSRYPCAANCSSDRKCVSTGWDNAAALSRELTRGCSVVLYSIAIERKANEFNKIGNYWNSRLSCSVLFLSHSSEYLRYHSGAKKVSNWNIVPVMGLEAFSNNRKASKIPKLFPQSFFADTVIYAMYIDAKISLRQHPINILRKHLLPYSDSNTFLTMVGHFTSRDIVEEVAGIDSARKMGRPRITYDYNLLRLQRDTYVALNITGAGYMVDTAVMMHKLKSNASLQFSCAWQRQLQKYSDRDQISLQGIIGWFSQGISEDPERHVDKFGTHSVDLKIDGEVANLHILSSEKYFWNGGNQSFSVLKRQKWNK